MSRNDDLSRGFGIVAKSVMRNPNISGPAKALYAVLSTYANDGGVCIPGNETLARDLGANPRTVKTWMGQLIEAGVVERVPRYVEGRQTSSQTVLRDVKSWREDHTVPPEEDGQVPHGEDRQVPQNNTSRNKTSKNSAPPTSPAPERWPVDAAFEEWASEELGIKNPHWLQLKVNDFLDWAGSVGKEYVDWNRAIKKAVRREAEQAGHRSNGQGPAPAEGEDLESMVRDWLWRNPVQHPPEQAEELERLERVDPHAYQRAMEPVVRAHRERAVAEVKRGQMVVQ